MLSAWNFLPYNQHFENIGGTVCILFIFINMFHGIGLILYV